MTDAEAIAIARAEQADIEDRIATGLIPPRPDGYDRDAFSAWFDEHLRCATPEHRYFVRARGADVCAACLAAASSSTRAA